MVSQKPSSSDHTLTRLPMLVPPATNNYNIIKRILADVYVKQVSHSLYHLWLDCLYDDQLTFENVLEGLRPVLGQLNRVDIPPRFVYLVAIQPSDDVPPKPAGSCFILISNSLIEKKTKSLNQFKLKILYNKIHMVKVSVAMLREQLKESCSLVFYEAFKNLINIPVKLLRTIMGMPIEDSTDVQQSQTQAEPKSEELKVKQKTKQPKRQQKRLSPQPPQEIPSKHKNKPISDSQLSSKKAPIKAKPKRIAASLNGVTDKTSSDQVELIEVLCSDSSNDLVIDESPATVNDASSQDFQSTEKLFKSLRYLGNIVIRVDNLPGKLTVQALNLMMGTFSLTSDQIVAVKRKRIGSELMDIRIVLHSNNIIEMQKILTKNACQTYYDSILRIELTNFDELEQFLKDNYDRIHRLDNSDKLPIDAIGYSTHEPEWRNKSFKITLK